MQALQIGSDEVQVHPHKVVIHARHPIRDWPIREFCRPAIHFRGQKFHLVARHQAPPPFATAYELAPWPPDLHEESPMSFTYDEEFVAHRDAQFRTEVKHTALWYALLPLYPFLGLCWSGFKERVLWPIGFVPVEITSASTFTVFLTMFCDALAFGYLGGGVVIHTFGIRAFGGWAMALDLAVIALLALDAAIRFNQILSGDIPVPYGFLEWLVPRRWRRRT